MGQKPSIKSIKKCKQFFRTLSLQETDYALLVKQNYCSTFLKSSGLLVQGEFWNRKSGSRNALVTFRDPKTGKVKGNDSWFNSLLITIFVGPCLWFNAPGRAITANEWNVFSVICFIFKKKQYLGVSGDKGLLEVFDVSMLEENKFLSRDYDFLIDLLFFWRSKFHKKLKSFKYFVLLFCWSQWEYLLTFRANQTGLVTRH